METDSHPAGYAERLEQELLVHQPFVDYLSLIEETNRQVGYARYVAWMYPTLWSRQWKWESIA